ncbi:MAG: type IV secretory system conjugative DNA transfer family protein [Bacteroidales bacterium]|jgi:type IV secretory pathway TraG/TraD family ATPase VirD4
MEEIKKIVKIFEIIFAVIFKIIDGVLGIFNYKEKGVYNAEFASSSKVFSFFSDYGFCLTGKKNLSVKDSYQNAIVIGGTGTGKSSVVLIPSIFTMKSSLIVHDPAKELFYKTSNYLNSKNIKVKVLNFADPSVSSNYNPLARANSSSEIQKIASMLVQNGLGENNNKENFWNIQATSLLAMLITILKKQDLEYQNLYNVRHLLNSLGGNPEAVDSLFSKYADEILFAEYKSFISYDEKIISSIIATCKASLQIFSDESIAKITSSDNLDFMEFRNRRTVLFIQNSVADQKYYSVLTSIFFEQFFSFIMSRFPKNDEEDIFFLVDEASSLRLPTLSLAVANVRKHRAGIMLLLQDFNQLVHNYGKYEADGIKANCYAKMYFTGASLETTTDLEKTLGKYEYVDKEEKKHVRPLMTGDEIRTMSKDEALLICGHHNPIKLKLVPYYKNFYLSDYGNLAPLELASQNNTDSISLLPLNVPEKVKNE